MDPSWITWKGFSFFGTERGTVITFEEFESLSKTYNVIPLVKTLLADLHTPVSVYLTLRQEGVPSFLFETVERDEKIGRFSFVGTAPRLSVSEGRDGVSVSDTNGTRLFAGNIFDALQSLSGEYRQAPAKEEEAAFGRRNNPGKIHGLTGGFVGFLGYNAVRHLENVPLPNDEERFPQHSRFDLFDSVIRFDHLLQSITIICNVFVDRATPLKAQYDQGRQKVDALELRLKRTALGAQQFLCHTAKAEDCTDKQEFCRSVEKAKRYIHEGDIFQVVLSRKLRLHCSGDLFAVYRALRVINPSPYLFFIDYGRTKLVGSSPEVLVRVDDGMVEVLPIAGTRPRGKSDEEDATLERDLLNDTKEVAEHVMLVDLGRNDVGRVAEYGTVQVPILQRVDRYSHVMHIVSHVRGRLKAGATALDALKSCFPAGTVSGAPKVRAMEIISELEGGTRGLYAGAVGYLGLDGTLDTCIAIRTIFGYDDRLTIQAGAGIVADSVPENEYRETVNKSGALLAALDMATRAFGPPSSGNGTGLPGSAGVAK
jgi:anthranilate synthase component 1